MQQVDIEEVAADPSNSTRAPSTGAISVGKLVLGAAAAEGSNAAAWLARNLTALIAFMKGGCHASYSTIRTFLRDCVGVTLARSTLANT